MIEYLKILLITYSFGCLVIVLFQEDCFGVDSDNDCCFQMTGGVWPFSQLGQNIYSLKLSKITRIIGRELMAYLFFCAKSSLAFY